MPRLPDGDADIDRCRAAGLLPAPRRGGARLQQKPGQTVKEPARPAQGAEAKVRFVGVASRRRLHPFRF